MSLKIATREDIVNWGKRKLYDFVSSDKQIHVRLQQLNAKELERIIKYEKSGKVNRPLLVVLSVVNEEGNRIFGDDDIDIIEKTFSLEALIAICKHIEGENGLGPKVEAEPDDAEGNSFATLS